MKHKTHLQSLFTRYFQILFLSRGSRQSQESPKRGLETNLITRNLQRNLQWTRAFCSLCSSWASLLYLQRMLSRLSYARGLLTCGFVKFTMPIKRISIPNSLARMAKRSTSSTSWMRRYCITPAHTKPILFFFQINLPSPRLFTFFFFFTNHSTFLSLLFFHYTSNTYSPSFSY